MHLALLAPLALLPLISAATCPAPPSCNPLLPSTYIYTAFTATRAQIDSYTKRSIENLLNYPNVAQGAFGGNGGWTGSNGWTAIADYDRIRGTKVFAKQVSTAWDALATHVGQGIPLINEFNDDSGWAGLATLRAYEAYGDKKYLDRTIAIWNYLNGQAIKQKDIDKGWLEGTKNPDVKIPATCNGKTMIGGLYWVNGWPDYSERAKTGGLNAIATNLFALLSAELCKTTGDKAKYCAAAYTSVQWLDNHMLRTDHLIWDNINDKCEVTDWTFTYNTGVYLSTYALLSSLTSNSTALAMAERSAKEAIKTPGWHDPNGVLKEGGGPEAESNDAISFKPALIRGLYRSFPYFKDEQLKSAVMEYINIQYYGMTQLASDSKVQPVAYGRKWNGPKFEVSIAHPQLAALDVLNAITINPDSAFLKAEKKDTPVIKEVKRVGGCV